MADAFEVQTAPCVRYCPQCGKPDGNDWREYNRLVQQGWIEPDETWYCDFCNTGSSMADWDAQTAVPDHPARPRQRMPNDVPEPLVKNENLMLKLIRRVMLLWCGYGLVKLCLLLNPFVFKLTSSLLPPPGKTWDPSSVADNVAAWVPVLGAVGVGMLLVSVTHVIAKAIFNEK